MNEVKADENRTIVREHYAQVSRGVTGELRFGEIEHLPVADGTVDVILSNCVSNLSPEKQAVFDEAFRVLRVGGRLATIADLARMRARHPIAEPREDLADERDDDDRVAASALAACLSVFVARLPSPYHEAVTLVELEGMTIRDEATTAGVSVSGMKSRVQRGRAQLRAMLDECCAIALGCSRQGDRCRAPAPPVLLRGNRALGGGRRLSSGNVALASRPDASQHEAMHRAR